MCLWNNSNNWCHCHRKLQETELEWEASQAHWGLGNIQILWDQKSHLHIHPSGKSPSSSDTVILSYLRRLVRLCFFLLIFIPLCPPCSVFGSAPFLSGTGQPDDCGDVTNRTGLSLFLLEDDGAAHTHLPHHTQHAGYNVCTPKQKSSLLSAAFNLLYNLLPLHFP